MIVKNVDKKENNTATLQVEIEATEFEKAVNAAYLKNKGKIAVPGFRKGKAPRMIIEGMFGADVFYDDAVNDLAPAALAYAVEQNELKTVGRPAIADMNVSDEKALTLTFEVALYPEVTLGEYKGLEVEKDKIEVTDADVEAELGRVQKRNARIQVVDRAAALDDTAVIDFLGTIDGVPFKGGEGKDYGLVLGSNTFIPGFEEQVVGMSAGEEKDVNVTFPEDYHADMAGKAAVFHVKCNQVKETVLPTLDDEFAKDVSEFDTFAEYKNNVRETLADNRKNAVERAFREAVLTKAAENLTVVIPDAMVEEQHEMMISEYAQSLSGQGIGLEQYIAMMGMSMDDFRNTTRPSAERQLRVNLMLDAVAKAENVQASDEELEEEFGKMATTYNMPVEEVKKAVPAESLRKDVIERKTADFVCESAVAMEKKAEEKVAE